MKRARCIKYIKGDRWYKKDIEVGEEFSVIDAGYCVEVIKDSEGKEICEIGDFSDEHFIIYEII